MKKLKKPTESKTLSKPERKVKNPAAKGKQFERDIANAIGHIFPDAQRMLEYQASKVEGVDLEGTGPYRIQCKNYANYCPIGKIREIRSLKPGDIPVLITKGIRMEPMVVLPFEDFIRMLERLHPREPEIKVDPRQITIDDLI